jgi:uncharacterized protein DUF6941
MDVQVAVLADYANIAAGDKLNVMGIFDTLFASAFPTVHPFMVLALRLRLGYDDGGKTHDLAVSLRDEDGREYLRAAAKANVPRIEPGRFQNVNQVINFAAMGFGKPGTYAFHIIWNGVEKTRVDLVVAQGAAPGAGAPPALPPP